MNYVREYYKQIKKGKIITSDKVKRLYAHLISNMNDKTLEYKYDNKKAMYAIDFIEHYCKHSKGKWAGTPVLLELWQKAAISALFGFVHKKTGLRQYKELILIVGRKNGKSTLASAIGLYLLIADGEAGPEIVSAATKKDQSKIIWKEAVSMIKKSPALTKRNKCLVNEICCLINDGNFKPLSSDSDTLDGLNVHGALIDELHAIKDKNLYDVIVDGMSAREQPLTVITSTAGTVRESIYDIKYEEGKNIIAGYDDPEGYKDEAVLPIFYELDKRSEWTDENCWYKANPGLGTVKKLEILKAKVERAKANPIYVKNLLTKDFNIRETASEAFLTFEQLNNEETFDLKTLKPRYAIGGVDLSMTTDLTCATLLFKLRDNERCFFVEQMYWIPEELFEKRVHEDKVPYDVWYEKGWVRKSPGHSIDYRLIVEWFKEIQEKHDVYLYKVGYDAWSAKYFVAEMVDYFGEVVMVPVIQGKKTLSGPMKALGADLGAKVINYNNNPILKWCMANTSVDMDKNGNIQPCKLQNPRQRIDGFASLLDAYVVYQECQEDYMNVI